MPGLYPPVEIRGRHFVDGALRRTMHASVALDHGVDLLLGINPMVPFDATAAHTAGTPTTPRVDGGVPVVLSQSFRTLLQSRAQVGLSRYAQDFPATDQVFLEPDSHDRRTFFTNVFSYSSRSAVCQHAYRATLDDLGKRRAELEPLLERHGLRLRAEVVDDPRRNADRRACACARTPPTRPSACGVRSTTWMPSCDDAGMHCARSEPRFVDGVNALDRTPKLPSNPDHSRFAQEDTPMAKLKSSARAKAAPEASNATSNVQDKAEQIKRSISGSAQHIWMAGVGAFNRAQEEGTRLFEALVKEGMNIESKTRKMATGKVDAVRDAVEEKVGAVRGRAADTWDRLEKVFEERVQRALTRLGVPGRDEIAALIDRVDQLNRELRKLSGAPEAARGRTVKKACREACCEFGSQTGG